MIALMASIALGTATVMQADAQTAFRKAIVDSRFVAEGVAVGDVNRDGRLDLLAGNVWYEAPHWRPHEIAPAANLDPKTQYSNCFHTWADDLNGDGWPDQIVIGMPGEKAIWRENPKGKAGHWKEHLIWHSAGNESPHYTDLHGKGKKVLVMGTDDDYLWWFEPASDPYAPWVCHRISGSKGAGSQRYSHGLGIGDLDGDGKNEVLTAKGYYVAPSDSRSSPWKFVAADLGPDCAHMVGLGPQKGLLTTSAHARGVWWFRPAPEGGFIRETIDETVSQTHAAILASLGKQSRPNLITGKRKWAHPPGVDVGSDEPSWLVRYELGSNGKWARHLIDDASGVGTQFVVQDLDSDGALDIVVANKNGVFVFWQTSSRTLSRTLSWSILARL
jgi:hypothetical protein